MNMVEQSKLGFGARLQSDFFGTQPKNTCHFVTYLPWIRQNPTR